MNPPSVLVAPARRGPGRPEDPQPMLAEVVRTDRVTPSMVRLTLAAPELVGFEHGGADHWFRMLLPRSGQSRPVLPTDGRSWWPQLQAMDAGVRPVLRNYTFRAARPADGEVDVDVVRHGDVGPGSRLAGAAPGGWVGLIDQGTTWAPPPDTDWHVVAGDETALPACAGIVAGLPAGGRALVLVEVPSLADVQPLAAPAGTVVRWIPRAGAPVGRELGRALREASFPPERCYAWVAGEAAMVRAVRRELVGRRGVPRDRVRSCGYWRAGRPAYDPA